MASKHTPKKVYKKDGLTSNVSRCKLCNCIADPKHSKNLFRKQNNSLLRNAEIIYGGELRQESDLPYRICAPCERRLNNAIQLRKVITDAQQALTENVGTKRCIEISLSVALPAKVVRTGTSRRRSLDFNVPADDSQTTSASGDPVSRFNFIYIVFYERLRLSHLGECNSHTTHAIVN
jgi:hypothetical protein